jgi:hypothetical protein
MELDAVVLFDALSQQRIAGLTAGERAIRVARRVGATRVLVVDRVRDQLAAWRGARRCPLLVLRADQLVHPPLVTPLIAAAPADGVAIAVGPDGGYAGALLATGEHAGRVIEALARGDGDAAIAEPASIAEAAALRVPHGEIARHPIATADERRAAHRLLYRILIKPQDNVITRVLYRPISSPLTRILVWTPITPNQLSYLVAAIVALGCWLTASASTARVIAGTAVILAAAYLDCCDGEVARLKLLSSRLGAWLDTIIDELSSVGYMAALGWHCHLAYGPRTLGDLGFDPWLAGIALGVVTYGGAMYCIYYNIIVGVGSANSQDYAGRFEIVPGGRPGSVRLRPAVARPIAPRRELPGWLAAIATYAPYVVRRDFISWAALGFVVLHGEALLFAGLTLGGIVTVVIVAIDHIQLRRLRRSIVRGGQILEPSS